MTREDAIKILTELANGTPKEGVYFSVREAAKFAIKELESIQTANSELEKEIEDFFKGWDKNSYGVLFTELGMAVNLGYVKTIARYFARWGAKNLK